MSPRHPSTAGLRVVQWIGDFGVVVINLRCNALLAGFPLELMQHSMGSNCSRQYCRLAGIKSHPNFCGVAFSLVPPFCATVPVSMGERSGKRPTAEHAPRHLRSIAAAGVSPYGAP